MLDSTDDGDDFTVEKGDTISIILPDPFMQNENFGPNYVWSLDSDELDDDIVSHAGFDIFDTMSIYMAFMAAGNDWYQQWLFEAEDVGTTTIKMTYGVLYQPDIVYPVIDTFEVEITVEED